MITYNLDFSPDLVWANEEGFRVVGRDQGFYCYRHPTQTEKSRKVNQVKLVKFNHVYKTNKTIFYGDKHYFVPHNAIFGDQEFVWRTPYELESFNRIYLGNKINLSSNYDLGNPYVAVSYRNKLLVAEPKNGFFSAKIDRSLKHNIADIKLSPDQEMVAYATSRDIVFINLETGQEKYILSNKDTYSIVHLAYALDGMTRLVYADWLDENGYAEEAEFIRIQCRLYSWLDRDFCFCPQCGKRMKNLRERMLVLFSEIKNNDILFSLNEILSIFGEISFLGISYYSYVFMGDHYCNSHYCNSNVYCAIERGFVNSVSLTLDEFMQFGKKLAQCQPVVCWNLTDCDPSWDSVECCWRWFISENPYGSGFNRAPAVLPREFHDGNMIYEAKTKTEANQILQKLCFNLARKP